MPFPFNLESSLEASEVYFLLNYNAFSNIRTRDLEEIRRMFADGRWNPKRQEHETTCIFSKIVIQLSKTNQRNEVSIVAEKKEKKYASDNAQLGILFLSTSLAS